MSSPGQQAEQTDEREHGQLAGASVPVEEASTAQIAPGKADVKEEQEKDVAHDGQAAVDAPTSEPSAADHKDDQPATPAPVGMGIDMGTETPDERAEVERRASEHLARRAAEMSVQTEAADTSEQQETTLVPENEGELPASPPPPPVPQKDDIHRESKDKGKATEEPEFNEKSAPEEGFNQEVPEAPTGTTEQTGEEIQTIMHQFQEEAALGEQEIMSPRLEKQQPIFHLPPRTSSLENQDDRQEPPIPKIERRDTEKFFGSPFTPESAPMASPRPERGGSTDDGASVTSHRTSLFQPPPPSPDPEPPAAFDFHRFLEQLRHRTADPVARYLRSFLQEFVKKQWAVHEQVKIIGDFLEFITKKMAQCEVWANLNDDEFDNAREGMEKLVMNRLYTQTFSPAIPAPSAPNTPRKGRTGRLAADAASPHGPGRRGQHEEDVERDAVIAQKMRIYGWIKEEHLDIQPVTGEKSQKFLAMAQKELLKINTYRAPRDKVICVLNTCKVLFGYLKSSSSKADQSADAFVPLLIYTVLRAAPEHLVSNVQYIWRFRNQDKLGGEAGYYMSSLTGVVTFIESLDRTSLTVSDEDFERNVETAVRAIAERPPPQPAATGPLPGLHHLSEKSTPARPEVTPRNSMDGERSSPRKSSQRSRSANPRTGASSDTIHGSGMHDEEFDAVGGLLRSIQKPLSSIGRIFSDDGGNGSGSEQQQQQAPPPVPPRPYPGEREAVKKASLEAEEGRRARAREERLVVETLQGMFPNLDREVIFDVVRAQEGHVGRAVDACLALTST
ncbi:hypothetical protein WHR41_04112 [Cladosporium halotolerans]|uniref:Guanine nucleotide exchange factor Vps9 n=1 Tax=Cladosporium halotolerans TaxID=1052096 RepID=A0AB34KSU9_9PEZI